MHDNPLIRHSRFWDRTGMFVAGLCVVHCILFPVLIILLPATRGVLHNAVFEGVILLSGILIGSISFTTSYRKHRKPWPMMLGLSGVALLAFSLFVYIDSDAHFEILKFPVDPFMVLGGVMLIGGHAWNLHACHCFCDRTCDHEEHEQSHQH